MKSRQPITCLSFSSRFASFLFSSLFIFLATAITSHSYSGNETDHHALLKFKSVITNDPYGALTSWSDSSHFCTWYGVSCGKRHRRVTALVLESQALKGSLSPHVGNLSFLQVLSLSNNSIQGTIPHELGRLSRLRRLVRELNNFKGTIPANLSGCSNLEELYLENNKLVGSIPKEISCFLPKLTLLSIGDNTLTGGIPHFLGNITSLEVFSAFDNQLDGSIPDTLDRLKSLTEFDCGNWPIPDAIGNLALLVIADLSSNRLNGHIPSSLGNCRNLIVLDLDDNELSGNIPKQLLQLPYLTILLNLSQNQLSGPLPTEVGDLQMLSQLDLSYNNLSANLIGEGDFSSVYRGTLDVDNDIVVAVKILHLQNRGAQRSFMRECEAWRCIRHRKLLKIITACSSIDFHGNDFKALVYEFTPNGSLEDWLHSSATTIFHGDLKPSNILLDDDMLAHVGDFGLARFLGTELNQNSSTGIRGTIGYAPPEYGLGSAMTSSGDVYSFGILLLEVMTGKKPTDNAFNEGLSLHEFSFITLHDHVTDVIDSDAIVLQITEANAQKMEECLASILKIGVSCSVDSPPRLQVYEYIVVHSFRSSTKVALLKETSARSSKN
nr:protein kinase-like domain-containing protein [Tanacetum cinerariifolium]